MQARVQGAWFWEKPKCRKSRRRAGTHTTRCGTRARERVRFARVLTFGDFCFSTAGATSKNREIYRSPPSPGAGAAAACGSAH